MSKFNLNTTCFSIHSYQSKLVHDGTWKGIYENKGYFLSKIIINLGSKKANINVLSKTEKIEIIF